MTPPLMVVGNWKMNGSRADLGEIEAIGCFVGALPAVHAGICVAAPLIADAVAVAGAAFVGGQDCHAIAGGAHTGGISAAMLRDAGACHILLGHSETRNDQAETNADVAAKVSTALAAGLRVILCVGEDLEQRTSGHAVDHVLKQLAGSLPADADCEHLVIAYEPVWSIGTGAPADAGEIAEMHDAIRSALVRNLGEAGRSVPILYGGSVNPANATEILSTAEFGGVLVGGASLKAECFVPIVIAASFVARARPRPVLGCEAAQRAS